MKKILASVLISTSFFAASSSSFAVDLTDWSGPENKGYCDEVQGAMRHWYKGRYWHSNEIGITYCNAGAYIVNNVRLKIKRLSDDAWIYKKDKTANLTAGYAHWFIADLATTNAGEKLKLEVIYDIATGDKKHCVKTFTMDHGTVMWLNKSGGTKTMGNKCKEITIKKSWD
jgi:hypothetical protein